ncbi:MULTISPECIES: hypothetical protein [unclassified Fusobacterium]|uniref:hypothetical protein n=1 Tax=unclassified Fusobacterium TaxID=2648384 RepID=UPI001B8D017A|nr:MULTISPECIES: hypothetical protein [unclassified Fusobacterium]MBR8701472.1 hypothetical protein [Fusobacterium sp. DD45]MBR8711239.1 hypothetical protein [Fusobacterium sp. DD28]MBR8751768.1 hypothetical protein [Fusobacterium sp. DD26]
MSTKEIEFDSGELRIYETVLGYLFILNTTSTISSSLTIEHNMKLKIKAQITFSGATGNNNSQSQFIRVTSNTLIIAIYNGCSLNPTAAWSAYIPKMY